MHIDPRIHLHALELDGFDVRCVLIRGSRFSLLWDTLAHPDQLAWLPDPPDFIVYSHADWDHIWGAGAVRNAVIIGHSSCADRFGTDVPETLRQFQVREPGRWDDVKLLAPTLTFDGCLSLDLGGLRIELHHLPGHTADSIVAFLPECGILLPGDTVETPCPCVPPNCNLTDWISRLVFWQDNPAIETVIPSHGRMGGKEILAENIAYLSRLKQGEIWALPPDTAPFYLQTHNENLANAGSAC